MNCRCDRQPVGSGRAGRYLKIAGALLPILLFTGCGETRGIILGEALLVDAASPPDATSPPDGAPDDSATIADGETLTAQAGGPGGVSYVDICPGNQVVIGYQGFVTAASVGATLVGAIETVCGVLTFGETSPDLATSPGATFPMRGNSRTGPWAQMCPANEVVVGFSGHSGLYLDQIAFECALWAATDGGDGGNLSSESAVTLTRRGAIPAGLSRPPAHPASSLGAATCGQATGWMRLVSSADPPASEPQRRQVRWKPGRPWPPLAIYPHQSRQRVPRAKQSHERALPPSGMQAGGRALHA
jgi:hypothetical protein